MGTPATKAPWMPIAPCSRPEPACNNTPCIRAGGQCVARGHVYGERFVPHVQKLGAFLTPVDLVGHGFPHGRPFGARGGQDVIDSELAESFDYGFAAVEPVFHGWSPRIVFFSAYHVTAEPARPLPGADINCGAALPSDNKEMGADITNNQQSIISLPLTTLARASSSSFSADTLPSSLIPLSAQKPARSRDAHRDINRALANRCHPNRTSHHRASPLAATGCCRDRQTAVAHGTGSGSAHSSPSPAAARHRCLARQTPRNNPRSSCRPRRERIRAIASRRCARRRGAARQAADRRTASAL